MQFEPIEKLLDYYGMSSKSLRDNECLRKFVKDNHITKYCTSQPDEFFMKVAHCTVKKEREMIWGTFEHECGMYHPDHYCIFKGVLDQIYMVSHNYGPVSEHRERTACYQKYMRIEVYDGKYSWYHPECSVIVYSPYGSYPIKIDCKRTKKVEV